jgi:phage N-6-adenine-methyltransferase
MNREVLFSSGSDEWETPDDLYRAYQYIFKMELDVAATLDNRKHVRYFGPDHDDPDLRDALAVDWFAHVGRGAVWMNPPYSRGLQKKFIAKAAEEQHKGVTTVALLPARTDTVAFHTHVYRRPNVDIEFLKGRVKFGGAEHGAPFPSMIVVFQGR